MLLRPIASRAIGQMYEEAQDGGTLSLAPIAEAVGGTYGLFFGARSSGGSIDEAFSHGVDQGYVHRLKEASVERLLPPWLDNLAAGSVFDRAAFGSDQAFGRTEFYNHVIRPEGRFHCVIATPTVTKERHFHLVVGRPRHKAEFRAEERRLMRFMLPHIAEVIRLRAELAVAKGAARQAQHFVDTLPMQMILVAADATVAFANREAQLALARRDSIGLDPKLRLTGATSNDTAALRHAIAASAADADFHARVLDLRAGGGEPLRITVSRIQEGHEAQSGLPGGPEVMILIAPQEKRADQHHAVTIARHHGLTRRETELATMLARGKSLQDAARELNMSYNTARAYLRQVFGKVDVHRQSDLIRLFTTGLRPDPGGFSHGAP